MMDFPGLAHVARGMEDILGDALESIIVLDTPTIALLQRSLSRLHQLLAGIRNGVNEEAVITEDDADYMQYRASIDASSAISPQNIPVASSNIVADNSPELSHLPIEAFPTSSMPSFDEVLASFRTSASSEGDDTVWPEEPMQPEVVPTSTQEELQPVAQSPEPEVAPTTVITSALDALVASTRQSSSPHFTPVENGSQAYANVAATKFPSEQEIPTTDPNQSIEAPIEQPFVVQEQEYALPAVYENVQDETRTLVSYASSLRNVSSQLHSAITIIEEQRSEFKGFLDGSKDALDRMEDWAGQAMGLNLKNSPEQVRRYLPLSVMWVSNSKLKKILELLKQITSGVELTDEQMHAVLTQLTTSIVSFGEAFQQMEQTKAQQPAWTPWEMQTPQEADQGIQERVTFERRGNMDVLRAEVEASVREEMRREYEDRSIVTAAARAELEQQLRSEIRQEFEEKRRLQTQNANIGTVDELRSELEEQLRDEIEIKVRQEFLSQIAANADTGYGSLALPPSPTPTTSNFADRARQSSGGNEREEVPAPGNREPVKATSPIENAAVAMPLSLSPIAQNTAPPPQPVNDGASAQSASSASALGGDFGEEATEIFRLEAEEHLQTISTYVAALEKDPTNREFIQGIRRATHTLKGAAAMMGFRAIAELSHVSEDLLDSIMEGKTPASADAVGLILDTAETLDVLITGNRTDTLSDEARVQALRIRYTNLLSGHGVALSTVSEDIDEETDEPVSDLAIVAGTVSETPETNAQRASRGDLSVRVRLQKLDELVNLFGELLVNRSVLEERIERLVRLVADVGISSNRLRDVGQKLESRFEAATLPSGRSVTVMPGDGGQPSTNGRNGKDEEPSHLADFDALEMDRYTEFHQVARGLSEGISDMSTLSAEMDTIIRECEGVFARENRLSTTVQDRLMKTRLVPLSTMTPRLYRAARSVALKQHKEFEFLLEGEETEIDRTVFEEIAGPLLHLVRNAINHGIETEEERIARGKSPKGQLTLSASYEGNQVVITVREDGRGIEPEQVRQVAIAHGLIRPEHALSENELIELIFRPGFSTAEVLSEESGRGVGLDVVRDSVSRLRGTIEVESTPGKGTAFTMKFPTSLAIQSAMMVRVSDQQFAVPIVMVESIGRLDTFKRTIVAGQPAVVVRNDLYPFVAANTD